MVTVYKDCFIQPLTHSCGYLAVGGTVPAAAGGAER